jgi:hypothetical protein
MGILGIARRDVAKHHFRFLTGSNRAHLLHDGHGDQNQEDTERNQKLPESFRLDHEFLSLKVKKPFISTGLHIPQSRRAPLIEA